MAIRICNISIACSVLASWCGVFFRKGSITLETQQCFICWFSKATFPAFVMFNYKYLWSLDFWVLTYLLALWNFFCICCLNANSWDPIHGNDFHFTIVRLYSFSGIWYLERPRSFQKVCKSIFGTLQGVHGNFLIYWQYQRIVYSWHALEEHHQTGKISVLKFMMFEGWKKSQENNVFCVLWFCLSCPSCKVFLIYYLYSQAQSFSDTEEFRDLQVCHDEVKIKLQSNSMPS